MTNYTEAVERGDDLHPEFSSLVPDQITKGREDVGDSEFIEEVTDPAAAPLTAAHEAPNPSGLSDAHRVEARDLALAAGLLAYHHRDSVHYTQNAFLRWQGIRDGLKAYQGEYPKNADCSSYATWCIWNGLDHFGVRDTVNGLAWKAGYTGTMLTHGDRASEWLMRGDCAIYGTSWPGHHTAIYVGAGMVLSHGSEAGPLYLPLHYRSDLLVVRRYI